MRGMVNTKYYNWQKEAKGYFSSTPKPKEWFEFLGWVITLSTLNFLSEKTNSLYIKVIYIISYGVLYNSIQKFLYTRKLQKYIPQKILFIKKSTLTYLISTILVILVYLFTIGVERDISSNLLK